MTDKQLLIGSLSNDLMRVASLTQRGSDKAAERFFIESKRWVSELMEADLKEYIQKIVKDLDSSTFKVGSMADAEKYLMYGILLQNYSLHMS